MDEYEQLLKELEALLRARHSLQCEDLVAWSRERSVGPVTLLSLVEDLIQMGVAEASIERELVDNFLELSLPKRLSLKQPRTPSPTHVSRVAQPRRKRRTGRGEELLRFLYEEEGGGAERATEARREASVSEEGEPVPQTQREALREEIIEEKGVPEEKEYVSALQYLYKYWSVGEYRFEADMKSLGVRDTATLLRRLQSEGLVEIAEPGVINARRELIEKRLKEALRSLPSSPLADLFG